MLDPPTPLAEPTATPAPAPTPTPPAPTAHRPAATPVLRGARPPSARRATDSLPAAGRAGVGLANHHRSTEHHARPRPTEPHERPRPAPTYSPFFPSLPTDPYDLVDPS